MSKSDFASGSISRHILALAGPLIVAQLVQMIYNIVDRMYLGHLPDSSLMLSSLGLTFPVITLIMAFTNLFSTGGVPLFSIARGAGQEKRASDLMGVTFFLLLCCSFVLMGTLYLFLDPLLKFLGALEQTLPLARLYLQIYLLGTPLIMIATGMNGFINAQGFAGMAMMTVLSGALLNMALDPLFIFVWNLGIAGAALASVLSQAVSVLWVLWFFRSRYTLFTLNKRNIRPDWSLTRQILPLGLAGFVMQATNGIVQAVCNISLSMLRGEQYIGIMAVLISLRDLTTAPISGLANAGQPVIGYNYGARKMPRVKKAVFFMTCLAVMYMLAAWALLMLFSKQAFLLFSNDTKLIETGITSMRIYFFGFFMMALQFSGQATFSGLGLAKQAIFFSLFRKVIIVVPLTLLLPLAGFGVDGVFLAEPISNWIGGLASFLTMLYTLQKLSRKEKA